MGDAFFRKRMGYNNPNKQATALVAEARYGNQGKWRGETFDKRPLVAGVHSGEPPGMDIMTVIYQERAMDPKWPAAPTNRMDMINPSWQQNVSAYGGHTGTVEMLASGHRAILPMANDSLEQISANAIDENKRLAIHDPLSNFYAAKTLGVNETLANARVADRLAEHNAKQTALKPDQVIVDSDGRVLSRENRKGMRKPHVVIQGMKTPADNMSRQSDWIQRQSKGGLHQAIKQDQQAIMLQNQGGGGGGGGGSSSYRHTSASGVSGTSSSYTPTRAKELLARNSAQTPSRPILRSPQYSGQNPAKTIISQYSESKTRTGRGYSTKNNNSNQPDSDSE